METQGTRRTKDGKLIGGPKLHIAPHQSPPGTPPPFLSLLDSFSALKASLRTTLPSFSDGDGILLPGTTNKSTKGKDSLKKKTGTKGLRIKSSPDNLESAKAALKQLEADGVIFSHPIHFLEEDEEKDDAEQPDTRSKSVPPGGKPSKKAKSKQSGAAGRNADLRQQHALIDEEESLEAPAKQVSRAVTEEEKAKERMKIDGALKLAESILLGRPYNRVDNVKYHGSAPLTFPSVQKYGGEAFELEDGGGRTYDKKKWEEHAKARAAGVTAMEQLLQRHHKLKEEKDALENEFEEYKALMQREKVAMNEMRIRTGELEQERLRLQKAIQKEQAGKEKEKQDHAREISRLQELLRTLREKCEKLVDEKNEMEGNQQDFDGASKKLQNSIETLRRELQEKNTKEREDASRIAKLVEESARLLLEKEALEHELEMLDEDFAYAKRKLKSAQQFAERVTKEHHEKMKVLNEKLSGRLQQAEEQLVEESNAHQDFAARLEVAERDLAFYTDRAGFLEGELKGTKELSHEANTKLTATSSELHLARTKNRWSWIICLNLVKNAFPPNDDKVCQTDGSITAEASTMTEFLSASGEFTRYWGEVVRAAHRINLKPADAQGKMSLSELLSFISTTYTRKLLADIVDEQTHFHKQSMQEFMLTYFLEVSGDKDSAFKSLATLIANVDHYLSMGPSAKLGPARDPKKMPVPSAGGKDGDQTLNLVAMTPRLQTFAKFLGIDQDGVDSMPLDALSVYLSTLLKVRKGQYPLLPAGVDKAAVSAADFVDSMDYTLAQLKQHERLGLKNHFYKDVSLGKAQVDLDSALGWVVTRWMESVHDKTDERLRSLFVSADSDGDGNLDFEEYFGMIRKLRIDQKELPPLPQLVRMYGKMMLGRRVDASIFVRIAREEELCPFNAGPSVDEIVIDKPTFASLLEEWRRIEPATVQMVRRLDGKPEGMRLATDVAVLRTLIGKRLQPEHTRHFLTCMTKVFHVPHALTPNPRQQGLGLIPTTLSRGGPVAGIGPAPTRSGGGAGQKKEASLLMGRGGGLMMGWSDLDALAPELVEEDKVEDRDVKSMIPGLMDDVGGRMQPMGAPLKPTFDVSDEDE